MNYEWQIKLQWEIGRIGYSLYMFRNLGMGEREFMTPKGIVKFKNGSAVKDDIALAWFESTEQLRQLIEEAEKQGVKAPTTERITGELEATKIHLADMRKLVFAPTSTNSEANKEA